MKAVRRWMAAICCALAGLCLASCNQAPLKAPSTAGAEPVHVEVYLIDPCGGCQGAAGMDCGECALMNEVTNRYQALLQEALAGGRASLSVYNMRKDLERYDERTARLAALGIERKDGPLPSVFVGDRLFSGAGSEDEAILSAVNTPAASTSEGQPVQSRTDDPAWDDTAVLYLFSPYCADCRQASPLIEQHAGDRLQKYDIATPEGLEMERAVHEWFNIPADQRITPLVVIGDAYLSGMDAIEEGLPRLMQ